LALLQLLGRSVMVTPAVQREFGQGLPDWVEVVAPIDSHYIKVLESELDAGEASAIVLSIELDNPLLILDDLKGRRMAERLGLRYSGTFGLLLKAKQMGIITSVKPILQKVRQTDFRFSEALFVQTLEAAGEV
jgi:predicted nucleic acid-binding protein